MAFVETVENKYGNLIAQFLRFVVVGFINTAINFAVLNLLRVSFHINKGEKVIWIAALAFIVATTNSWYMNKFWAFKDHGNAEGGRKPTLFLIVSLIGLTINSTIIYLFTTFIHGSAFIMSHFSLTQLNADALWFNIAAVIATGVSLVWNFIGYKLFVFKN